MALDLESLQDVGTDRWNREWQRAWDEVQLWDVAATVVRYYLGRRFPQWVEGVAADALITLSEKAIHRCRTVEGIVPLLRKIAHDAAVAFLRRPRVRHEVRAPEDEEIAEVPRQDYEPNFQRLMDEIAERLHLECFDEEAFIHFLVREAELNLLEEALLREHILDGCTQQEFADKYGLSVRGIGGRKGRLLRKIRDCWGESGLVIFPV